MSPELMQQWLDLVKDAPVTSGLRDQALEVVDPFDRTLSLDLQLRVYEECKRNPRYFFTHILKASKESVRYMDTLAIGVAQAEKKEMLHPETGQRLIELKIDDMSKEAAALAMLELVKHHPFSHPWGTLPERPTPTNLADKVIAAKELYWDCARRAPATVTTAQIEHMFEELQVKWYGKSFLKIKAHGPDLTFTYLEEDGGWHPL